MKRVDRLVAMTVLSAVAAVWVVLVGLDAFRVLVMEFDGVGEGRYTLVTAATSVLLSLPRRFYEMYGHAALVGGLLGLGSLAATGELTALRAAGLSRLRICASVVFGLALLMVAVVVLGETLAPAGERRSQALVLAAKSDDVSLARGGTLWARDGNMVVAARRARVLDADTVELAGVRVFEFEDDGRLAALTLAAVARHDAEGWSLHEARRTEFHAQEAVTRAEATQRWQSSLDVRLLAGGIIRPQYMSLHELARNVAWLSRNGQDAEGFRRAWWERAFYPVEVLVLAFCALPFAFGTLRSGGLSRRLFLGVVIALGFHFLHKTTVSFGAVYGMHPALANLLPPLLVVGLAGAYFRRHA